MPEVKFTVNNYFELYNMIQMVCFTFLNSHYGNENSEKK